MLSSFIEDRGSGSGGETHIYRNDQVASFLLFSSSSNISIIGKISAVVLSVATCAAPHIVALFALIGTDRFLLWNTVTRQQRQGRPVSNVDKLAEDPLVIGSICSPVKSCLCQICKKKHFLPDATATRLYFATLPSDNCNHCFPA